MAGSSTVAVAYGPPPADNINSGGSKKDLKRGQGVRNQDFREDARSSCSKCISHPPPNRLPRLNVAEANRNPYLPWQRLYFFPEPHGHGSLRPTLSPSRLTGVAPASSRSAPWLITICWGPALLDLLDLLLARDLHREDLFRDVLLHHPIISSNIEKPSAGTRPADSAGHNRAARFPPSGDPSPADGPSIARPTSAAERFFRSGASRGE